PCCPIHDDLLAALPESPPAPPVNLQANPAQPLDSSRRWATPVQLSKVDGVRANPPLGTGLRRRRVGVSQMRKRTSALPCFPEPGTGHFRLPSGTEVALRHPVEDKLRCDQSHLGSCI